MAKGRAEQITSKIPGALNTLLFPMVSKEEISEKAAREVSKVLKPGGLFMICEGNPPTVRSIDWYSKMFAYKEERNTLTEIDLVNIFYRCGIF